MNDSTTRPESISGRKLLVSFAFIILIGAFLSLVMSAAQNPLSEGVAAPSFSLTALNENEAVTLESLRGKIVVVDFWSTSCPPCVRQMADLERLHQRHDSADVVVLGVNTENAPEAILRRFARERDVHYPILLNGGAVSEEYQVTALPTLYVIDQEGNIRWSHVGYAPYHMLEEPVEALLD